MLRKQCCLMPNNYPKCQLCKNTPCLPLSMSRNVLLCLGSIGHLTAEPWAVVPVHVLSGITCTDPRNASVDALRSSAQSVVHVFTPHKHLISLSSAWKADDPRGNRCHRSCLKDELGEQMSPVTIVHRLHSSQKCIYEWSHHISSHSASK